MMFSFQPEDGRIYEFRIAPKNEDAVLNQVTSLPPSWRYQDSEWTEQDLKIVAVPNEYSSLDLELEYDMLWVLQNGIWRIQDLAYRYTRAQ